MTNSKFPNSKQIATKQKNIRPIDSPDSLGRIFYSSVCLERFLGRNIFLLEPGEISDNIGRIEKWRRVLVYVCFATK